MTGNTEDGFVYNYEKHFEGGEKTCLFANCQGTLFQVPPTITARGKTERGYRCDSCPAEYAVMFQEGETKIEYVFMWIAKTEIYLN